MVTKSIYELMGQKKKIKADSCVCRETRYQHDAWRPGDTTTTPQVSLQDVAIFSTGSMYDPERKKCRTADNIQEYFASGALYKFHALCEKYKRKHGLEQFVGIEIEASILTMMKPVCGNSTRIYVVAPQIYKFN